MKFGEKTKKKIQSRPRHILKKLLTYNKIQTCANDMIRVHGGCNARQANARSKFGDATSLEQATIVENVIGQQQGATPNLQSHQR